MNIALTTSINLPTQNIVIAGAGAIGNYVGVQLHKAGFCVSFLGSDRVVNAEKKSGIALEYPDDSLDHFLPSTLKFTTSPRVCVGADLVIICVKSLLTPLLIMQLKPYIKSTTALLTLQNGISNVANLKAAFPTNCVYGGMVTFNVIEKKPSTFRLTTHGEIYLEKMTPSLVPVFQKANMLAKEHTHMESFLWSKLLLNLINPLNALSGKSLKQNLEDQSFRLQWAACMREGMAVLKAASIKPAKVTPLPPHLLPLMVSLPNWIYLRLAKNMTDMDPTAKSSMAQDFEKGKLTEIDYLSGEIIKLGKYVGVATPENEKVYNAVKESEKIQHLD